MTKIMSISLAMFLWCSNQLMCHEKQTLQRVICSGNHVTKTTTLHSDAEIELTGNHNYLECNALPSVKKIVIKTNGNHNQAIVQMPFCGEMPEVTCRHVGSNHAQVTIYSFKDIEMNYVDSGNHNSCRVISPLRKLIVPLVGASSVGLLYMGILYWKFSEKK